MRLTLMMVLLASVCPAATGAPSEERAAPATAFAAWENGPPSDPSYFPIAVWLQQPRLAPKYKAAGINLYVGLWKGPTEKQLATLRKAGMPVICAQNEVGLAHRDDPTIVGWMHGDEPDNAQRRPDGKGYGPPIPPSKIVADYRRIRRADPTRPVLLNLGQGVAWDGWHGRGVRTNHPEDYPLYVRGADIVSFDIYPVNHSKPAVRGKLWYVARGVERLVGWTGGRKIVWNCLECTRIRGPRRPTPHEVRAEAWMALIHGSRGLIWFVHQWEPRFNSHALLDDKEMLATVTEINRRIRELAPVLNGPAADAAVDVTSGDPGVPVRTTARRHGGHLYVFAVAMRERPLDDAPDKRTDATFRVRGVPQGASVEVLYENRRIPLRGGRFADSFAPWGVHIYRIARADAED